ncbi:hypothetical protein GJ744_009784 [Endocarpon pusillum]|uniref:Zn(2)-C6 fungal-type domain-containing protein n=1 Tax=Endocarpon pusillum TaxID=364733 RepID=A0A8H7AQG0_9EURO|nr:hypothetical protein GJ744_009784 [Endocarpon pusillum]
MSKTDTSAKQHSACDECRKRKLRCSGQPMGCTRCTKQHLTCHYSLQLQMGRPRKRRKIAEEPGEGQLPHSALAEMLVSNANGLNETNQLVQNGFQMVHQDSCPIPTPSSTSSATPPSLAPVPDEDLLFDDFGSFSNGINHIDNDATPPSHSPTTPSLSAILESFPSTFDWNDYLNTTNLPVSVSNACSPKIWTSTHLPPIASDGLATHHYNPVVTSTLPPFTPSPVDLPCTCLPDLCLALSNLSTLTSLPMNPNTIETLQTATRTGHSVLYCPKCPQKFQSSMQNLMLLATLLSGIADSWSHILRASPQDLARGFSIDPNVRTSTSTDPANSRTETEEAEWKLFAHYLIRQYVFGDAPPPGIHLPGICPILSSASSSACPSKPPLIILQNLCDAFERRQKTYHGLIAATGEFPRAHHSTEASATLGRVNCDKELRSKTSDATNHEKNDALCLRIVKGVRSTLALLDTRADPERRTEWQVRLNKMLGR